MAVSVFLAAASGCSGVVEPKPAEGFVAYLASVDADGVFQKVVGTKNSSYGPSRMFEFGPYQINVITNMFRDPMRGGFGTHGTSELILSFKIKGALAKLSGIPVLSQGRNQIQPTKIALSGHCLPANSVPGEREQVMAELNYTESNGAGCALIWYESPAIDFSDFRVEGLSVDVQGSSTHKLVFIFKQVVELI